jgi:hypothetical protein
MPTKNAADVRKADLHEQRKLICPAKKDRKIPNCPFLEKRILFYVLAKSLQQITQISCFDSNHLAPSGCTQYYTGTSGTIQSFNWQNMVQLANQNQKICFR